MNALQTTIRSTPQFLTKPPDYFITESKKRPGGHEHHNGGDAEILHIPKYTPSSYGLPPHDPKDDSSSGHHDHQHRGPHHRHHEHHQRWSSSADEQPHSPHRHNMHHHHHHHQHHGDHHQDPSQDSSSGTHLHGQHHHHGHHHRHSNDDRSSSSQRRDESSDTTDRSPLHLHNTKTIQQFHSFMTNLGVHREKDKFPKIHHHHHHHHDDHDHEKSHHHHHRTFDTKRLVSVQGERMLAALKGVCTKLEILAVLPQIMSRLAVGDLELEEILGPECTDAILQLLYIQMAWLEYRCPQPEPGANFMGKTLHQIKRRLQKGVRAKMTKLKFPNALSQERLDRTMTRSSRGGHGQGDDDESVYDIQDNIRHLKDDKEKNWEPPKSGGQGSEFDVSVQSFIDFLPKDEPQSGQEKNKIVRKKLGSIPGKNKCENDPIQLYQNLMTEEERDRLKAFIDGEAHRTEQRTNSAMRSLMTQALKGVDGTAAETVFHDIFYDTIVRNHPPTKRISPNNNYQKRKKSRGERALDKYRLLHRTKKHRPDCPKCVKDPHRCLTVTSKTRPNLSIGLMNKKKKILRPVCLKFGMRRKQQQQNQEYFGEQGSTGTEFEGWGSENNPLDDFLTDTELDEEEEEAYMDCIKSLDGRTATATATATTVTSEVMKNDNVVSSRSSMKKKSHHVHHDEPKSPEKDQKTKISSVAIKESGGGMVKNEQIDQKSSSPHGQVETKNEELESVSRTTSTIKSKNDIDDSDPISTRSSRHNDNMISLSTKESRMGGSESMTKPTFVRDSRASSSLKVGVPLQEDHHHEDHHDDELEFDRRGNLVASADIPETRLKAVRTLLADPSKSKFLRRLIGVKAEDDDDEEEEEGGQDDGPLKRKNVLRRRALQKKRLHLVKRALVGPCGKHVRRALLDKNVRELLFLVQLDRTMREEQMDMDEDENEADGDDEGEGGEVNKRKLPPSPPSEDEEVTEEEKRRRKKFEKIFKHRKETLKNRQNSSFSSYGTGNRAATWRQRWYGSKGQFGDGKKEDLNGKFQGRGGRGWRLVRENRSRLCLVKQWRDSRGQWQSRKIRLNKDNKPETMEERKHRLLDKMNRRLERERRIQELQNLFGEEIPRIAYEKYEREKNKGKTDGSVKTKYLCRTFKNDEGDEDEGFESECEPPKFNVSSDDSKSSSSEEEDGHYRIVVTDPYPFNKPLTQSAPVATANSSKRPKSSGLAETIGIPENSESYKLGSIRMLTGNYNIGRMAALEMPWIGPELFGISSDQYNSEQLKAAYREVLRVVCLNERGLQWISQQIKPEVTQAVKLFYGQIQVLQGLMYARLLMSPQEEVSQIHYLKQTWIREQRLLRLHQSLDDELGKLEKEREEMMVTLNESINNFIGQIDHAYLQCHQEIVKTIAEYTKMELVTTKSVDHALQELHGTLQKCITAASIMRAKFAEAEDKLQKNKFKLLADWEALIGQYDSEMFGRQEVMDQLRGEEETNKVELNRIEDQLKKVEHRYALMKEEARLKAEDGKKKRRPKKVKSKKRKRRKGKRSKKRGGRRSKKNKRSRRSRGRKGKKKKKRKSKLTSAGEEEESTDYEGEEGDTSGTESLRKKGKKSKSKSPKDPKKKKIRRVERSDLDSVDLGSDAEVKVKAKVGKKKGKKKGVKSVGSVPATVAGKVKSKKIGPPGRKKEATTSGEENSEGPTTEEEEEGRDVDKDTPVVASKKVVKTRSGGVKAGGGGTAGKKDKKVAAVDDKKKKKKHLKKDNGVKKSSKKSSAKASKASLRPSKAVVSDVDDDDGDFDEPPTPPGEKKKVEAGGAEVSENVHRKSRARLSVSSSKKEEGEGAGEENSAAKKSKRSRSKKKKSKKNSKGSTKKSKKRSKSKKKKMKSKSPRR